MISVHCSEQRLRNPKAKKLLRARTIDRTHSLHVYSNRRTTTVLQQTIFYSLRRWQNIHHGYVHSYSISSDGLLKIITK